MKNKTIAVILVALALVVAALYNVVTVVATYDEWLAEELDLYTTPEKVISREVLTNQAVADERRPYARWRVRHRKVLLKQRLLTGQTWPEYIYDN